MPIDGDGPPRDGGIVSGYDQVKSPVEPPACQVAEGERPVAPNEPPSLLSPLISASTVPPPTFATDPLESAVIPANVTSASMVAFFVSLTKATGWARHPAADGVVRAQSGSRTNLRRPAQSPPYASRN